MIVNTVTDRQMKKIIGNYFNCLVTRAKFQHTCHACNKKIPQGTFYISIVYYKSLWYKFHTSTKCRLIGAYASGMMVDIYKVDETEKDDLIWYFGRKEHYLVAHEFGFISLKIALENVERYFS